MTPLIGTNEALTDRELMVLGKAAIGAENKAIALEMHLSVDTVCKDWREIRRKLGATNIAAAVYLAAKEGII